MLNRAVFFGLLLVAMVGPGCSSSATPGTPATPDAGTTDAGTDGGKSDAGSDGGTDAGTDGGAVASSRERLYVGTGEYSATQDWHAVLRFDDAQLINTPDASSVDASATIPIQQTTATDGGIALNFAHTFYVVESRNEMYIGSLFTTADNSKLKDGGGQYGPTDQLGSIGILANANTANGPQILARHIFGSNTQIFQPHGVWVDESRDMLYAANTFGKQILVWSDAGTVNGNVAPTRAITHSKIGNPVFVYVDSASDRMFIASMNTTADAGFPNKAAIAVYNNASAVNGAAEPTFRIAGASTGLDRPNNQTTHNVWYDSTRKLLIVGHHTFEVFFYDLNAINMTPDASTDYDLTPRVLMVHDDSAGSDIYKWSTYGIFFLPEKDRLYVALGYLPGGNQAGTGGPQNGAPPNQVKVYDGLSDAGLWTGAAPWIDAGQGGDAGPAIWRAANRVIHWSSGATYYPPQPLWVTRY